MTTAYRSKLWLERYGWTAAVVEHRRGKFRYDLFRIVDVVAIPPEGSQGILFVQSYLDTARDRERHKGMDCNHEIIQKILKSGSFFVHHRWSKNRGVWRVRILDMKGIITEP